MPVRVYRAVHRAHHRQGAERRERQPGPRSRHLLRFAMPIRTDLRTHVEPCLPPLTKGDYTRVTLEAARLYLRGRRG